MNAAILVFLSLIRCFNCCETFSSEQQCRRAKVVTSSQGFCLAIVHESVIVCVCVWTRRGLTRKPNVHINSTLLNNIKTGPVVIFLVHVLTDSNFQSTKRGGQFRELCIIEMSKQEMSAHCISHEFRHRHGCCCVFRLEFQSECFAHCLCCFRLGCWTNQTWLCAHGTQCSLELTQIISVAHRSEYLCFERVYSS